MRRSPVEVALQGNEHFVTDLKSTEYRRLGKFRLTDILHLTPYIYKGFIGPHGLPLKYPGHTFGRKAVATWGIHEQGIGETLVGEAQAGGGLAPAAG